MAASKRFVGTDRFRVLSRLGHGGMGAVYEVLDTEQNRRVALKTLRQLDPKALLRFKNEYRALRELQHPNLVRLGELLRHDGLWLFTMELVEGTDFLSYAHGNWKIRMSWRRESPTAAGHRLAAEREGAPVAASPSRSPFPPIDEARIRDALAQLARGLTALHDVGQVHRDIKPSNVMVTSTSRVVILDLGLAASVEGDELQSSEAVGTSEYMSPEQAMGRTVGTAADWYSAGVVLYEVLTGRVPFEGDHIDISIRKQEVEPPPPAEVVPDCPALLSELCARMLSIEPGDRPTGREVLDALGAPLEPPRAHRRAGVAHRDTPFVGRTDALETLRRAFADGCSRGAVVVRVRGEPGVGKTALVARFAEQTELEHPDAAVMSGRCYHGGNVPYKALDHVIDMLATYLGKRPDDEVDALIPDGADVIPLLFPVMRRVRAFKRLDVPTDVAADPHGVRDRGFAALRALLANIGATRPLIIAIDDIQWSDLDSRVLLEALTAAPSAPPLLLVLSGRDDDDHPVDQWLTTEPRDIELPPLGEADVRRLAGALLDADDTDVEPMTSLVAAAGGNPLFIHELARFYQATSTESVPPADFAGFVWERATAFGDDGIIVLRVLAVAGRPLPQKVVAEAAGVEYRAFAELVAELVDVHLVATSGGTRDDTLAPLHDRVRTAVLDGVDGDALRDAHARVAAALEATGVTGTYPELMVESLAAAGQTAEAARYAELGAQRSIDALAFDRAAQFFARAVELAPRAANARALRLALADALIQAGRGADAADHLLELAESADAATALEHRRRAAEQLLTAGRLQRGREVLHGVLREQGIAIPSSAGQTVRALMWDGLRTAFGVTPRVVPTESLDPDRLWRADLCRTAVVGLQPVDPLAGAYFQAQYLRHALAAGEAMRMCRALAMSAAFASLRLPRGKRRADRLLAAATALAADIGDEVAAGQIELANAVAALSAGQFADAAERFDRAEALFAQAVLVGAPDVRWELDLTRFFALQVRRITADYAILSERVPALLRSALERGHDLAAARMYSMSAVVALGQDRVAGARTAIERAIAMWPTSGVDPQARWMLTTRVEVDLYAGDAEMAVERIESRWDELNRAHLSRVTGVAAQFWWLRGRAATAVLADQRGASRRRILRERIRRAADYLSRSRLGWAMAFGDVLRAALALDGGQHGAARDHLGAALGAFDRAGARLFAESARWARGRGIVRGAAGARQAADAASALRATGVTAPERLAACVIPGFPG